MNLRDVFAAAERAKAEGATRFCMGAAWRQVTDGKDFERVLEMVRGVSALDMEVCCTLGMLTRIAGRAAEGSGTYAPTTTISIRRRSFTANVITTRVYEDRLQTIAHVRKAGITVCCGGILGMGESDEDRIGLLEQLARLDPHPESVPINMLVANEGTPLATRKNSIR